MKELTPEQVVEWAPDFAALVESRGWQHTATVLAEMKAEIVNTLAYMAEEKDIPFLRGQLVALDTLAGLPANIAAAAARIREDVRDAETFRRSARKAMGMTTAGEVSQ